MSEVKVNKVSPRSGTTVTIGDSGDTINIVGTLQNNGSPLAGDISSVVAGTGLSGGATSGVATLNIEAAQPTITSLGTITGFTSTGIDDNADALAITIDSSENVGIKNTTMSSFSNLPATDLVVGSGSTHSGITIYSGTSSGSNIAFADGASGDARNQGIIQYHHNGDYMRFFTSASERMRLTSTGLGIGTSSPSTSLHISQSVPIITLTDTDTSVSHQLSGQSGSRHLNLKVDTGGSSGSPVFNLSMQDSIKLSVLNSGNVGIGTTSPGQTLDVVGNAEINGNIYNNGKLNIRKDGASERKHLVITNEQGGSNSSPTYRDIHFNGYSGKDRGRITVQDRSNNKVGGFMELQTARSESTDGSGLKTSIFLDNDGDILFYEDTGTTPKVKWDATNERFGIGTTVPTSLLHLSSTSPVITFEETDQSNRQFQIGSFGNAYAIYDATNTQYRYILDNSGNHIFNEGGADCDFRVESDNSTHALFVQGSDGNVGINTNSPAHKIELHGDGGNTIFAIRDTDASPTFSNRYIKFQDANGTEIGKILRQGSAVSYSTSSDYRLKENVVEMTDATERLKQLQPKRFNFIGYDNVFDGFIAHEVSSIVPEAISGEKDAVNEDGTPEYQGIDQAKLVPLLVKTIQELEARITTLENA